MVDLYYLYSPSMADYISQRMWLRGLIQTLLAPVIFTVVHPVIALIMFTGLAIFIIRRRRHAVRQR